MRRTLACRSERSGRCPFPPFASPRWVGPASERRDTVSQHAGLQIHVGYARNGSNCFVSETVILCEIRICAPRTLTYLRPTCTHTMPPFRLSYLPRYMRCYPCTASYSTQLPNISARSAAGRVLAMGQQVQGGTRTKTPRKNKKSQLGHDYAMCRPADATCPGLQL